MRLLLDGGKFNETTIELLKDNVDNTKPLLYIPFAWKDSTYSGCIDWLTTKVEEIGFSYIDMVKSTEELDSKDLSTYSAMFVGGGNTYKLLQDLKFNNSFNKIIEYLKNDGILCGSSAGAVICSKDIDVISCMDPNEVQLKDTKGFDLVEEVSIFPHYTNTKSDLTEKENEERMNKYTHSIIEFSKNIGRVLAIPEEDVAYYEDGKLTVLETLPYYDVINGILSKKEATSYSKIKKDKKGKFYI